MRTLLIIMTLSFASLIITSQDLIVDGKIGIATTTASAPLHIKGNNEALRIEGIQPWLSFYTSTARNGYIQHDGVNMWLVNENHGRIYFRTSNIDRMIIEGDGRVGIGTSNPIARLMVEEQTGTAIWGKSTSNVGIFGESDTSAGVAGVSFSDIGVWGNSGNPDQFDFFCDTDDGSNGYGQSSSIRWKKDVRNIDEPIFKLSQLRGVYFNWKEEFGGNHAVGFIAEEVGEVLPEIVVYEENGIDAVGLDYSKMTPLLVEAANAMRQEYQATFDDQQSEINALKRDLAELRALLKAYFNTTSED